MQDVQTTLSVGTLIRERYVVKSLLSEDHSSTVYLVEDQREQRSEQHVFALQEVPGLNQQERYQCIFESVLLRKINHPALPRIYHVFNDDMRGQVCLVMDYVEGLDLETVRQQQREQCFPWPEVARMMAPIVDALSYLHRQEPPIVHGNIKPSTIRIARSDERCMLVDIGVARDSTAIDALPTTPRRGDPRGRPGESLQPDARAKPNARATTRVAPTGSQIQATDVYADIYGLGATCYTLLTGKVPVPAFERATQLEQGQGDPLKPAHAVVSAVPLYVSQAIYRAMSINGHERFSSVEEFWHVLQTPPLPKELKPTVATSELPVIIAPPVVTKQFQTLADMQTPLLPMRQSRDTVPFLYLKRRAISLLLLIFFLLVSTVVGTSLFVQSHQKIAIAPRRGSTISATLSAPSQKTAPIVTPTSSPGSYPDVVGSYTGTLVDISTKVSETLILQGVHQIGDAITGYVTMGSSQVMSGQFSGTIDFSKHFRLLVNDDVGHPLFFLEGAMQTATSLSGDFYRCASAPTLGNTCVRAVNGYGIWNAQLLPFSSS